MRPGFLLLTAVMLLAIGCSNESGEPSDTDSAPVRVEQSLSIREGGRLFAHYCSPCHGETGDGFGRYYAYDLKPRPADFTAPDFLKNRSDERLHLSISEGTVALGKSNMCPPWGNTFLDDEIGYLITYIKKLNRDANSEDTPGQTGDPG